MKFTNKVLELVSKLVVHSSIKFTILDLLPYVSSTRHVYYVTVCMSIWLRAYLRMYLI